MPTKVKRQRRVKSDYRSTARAYARKYDINPVYFQNQMTQEAHGEDLTSPAGAEGPAQIMPATARSWGVKDPHDLRQSYDAAAKHMADYLKAYGGDWSKALTAYNAGPGRVGGALPAETQNYIKTILKGGDKVDSGSHDSPEPATTTKTVPGVSREADRKALIVDYLQNRAPHDTTGSALLQTLVARSQIKDTPAQTVRVRASRSSSGGGPADTSASAKGSVQLEPGANKPGTNLQPIVTDYLKQLSALRGQTIKVGTGTNHSYLTVNGNVSDHSTGNAADIPVPVDSSLGDRTAMRALELAGVPDKQAAQMARKGGLFTLNPTSGPFKGHRIQVIWKTYAGGNHHNHVHVGVR